MSRVNGRIETRVDVDSGSAAGTTEYAFYWFYEGRHAGFREFEPSRQSSFALSGPGHYAVTVFSRAAGDVSGERIGACEIVVEGDAGRAGPAVHKAPQAAVRHLAAVVPSGDGDEGGAILHIGLPKTGTTYLQRTFHTAFAGIDEVPIDYPDTGFYNHQIALYEPLGQYLPWKVRTGSGDHWKRLAGHLSSVGKRPLLLSAEALSALNASGVAAFRQLLGGRKAQRIIITTRPLVTLLPSHWQQNMKQGGRGDLESYAHRILSAIAAGESPAQMFCVRETVKLWREEFPDSPVSVLVMDGGHTENLLAFADTCGLGGDTYWPRLLSSVPAASEQNLSFSLEECQKLLSINERIARGQLPVSERRKAMDSFFSERASGASYAKPELSAELRAIANGIDEQAFAELVDAALVEVRRGRDQASPPSFAT